MAEAPVKIRVAGLAKSFGGREVLRGIDLDIAAGRRTAIIGPAAAGKSVLMKCLVGLHRPERGSIAIDGRDLTRASGADRAELLRDVGVLFQQGGLFDSLPVWENVAFKLVNRLRVGRARAREAALEKLAEVGLPASVADLYPAQISGGMQKRVGIARAVAGDPSCLFLDSPTAGLDPVTSNRIDAMVGRTAARLGATTVCITSDMTAARTLYDDLIMLHEGRLVWRGATADIAASGDPHLEQMIAGRAEGPIRMPILTRG